MSHTLDDDFEHFLCYQNWNGLSWATKRLLKIAYEHGNRLERESGEAVDEAYERAAKVCDDISVDRFRLYKGRPPYTGSEPGRADPSVQGQSDGADDCADAIRALIVKGG